MSFKYIFFDCMETLVDLHVLPGSREYASWAFDGSGCEELWEDFDTFHRYYILSKHELASQLPEHADYEMKLRFLHILKLSQPDIGYDRMEAAADCLRTNYWKNYKSVCYLKQDVKAVLPRLGRLFKLGVVSNFMVKDGIQELLELTDISKHFEFVVVSVDEGIRKPHPAIYGKALQLAGVKPEEVIFVGDDYINDYVKPAELGMYTICLDRYEKHAELERRVRDFNELEELIGRIDGRF
ncbi:MAG TPA: HAD family hydrolase [Clostridia bacterium]|nr:HAD family hydrolase [Clostridia bacterium]